MKILAIESSTIKSEIALLDNKRCLSTKKANNKQQSSSCLTALIEEAIKETKLTTCEIDLVAVSIGPGSFTGLRVGCVIAKTIGYAMGTPIVAVPTHQIIASQGAEHFRSTEENLVRVISDGQRKQLFASEWSLDELGQVGAGTWPVIVDPVDWIQSISQSDLLCGAGIKLLRDFGLSHQYLANESTWQPTAETLGRIGQDKFERGEVADLWSLTPFYLRPSAAEEKAKKA